jgi:hypothetical protein
MRKAVKKPTPSLKRQVKAIGAAEYGLVQKNIVISAKPVVMTHRPKIMSDIKKSPLVKHFSDVAPATRSKAAFDRIEVRAPKPKVIADVSSVAHNQTSPRHTKTADELIESAMKKALAHESPRLAKPKKKHSRNKIWLVGLMAFILIALYASDHIADFKTVSAANKFSISSSLPSYVPLGFSLKSTVDSKYSGELSARYADTTNAGQSYSIVEKDSLWSNLDLQSDYVNGIDPSAITKTVDGRTVYLYGNEDATWIFKGVWYVVNSNGELTNSQLLSIAKSS